MKFGRRIAAGSAQQEAEWRRWTETKGVLESAQAAGALKRFPSLGVQGVGAEVFSLGRPTVNARGVQVGDTSHLLGPLAGAEAVVTSGTQAFSLGRAALMPLELAPLARKTMADAIIVFPDGTTYDHALNGNQEVRAAQRETVQFNALARWAAGQQHSGRRDDLA